MAQYRRNHPYDAGFALPANVMAEPPGRGTLTTQQLPRKTFSAMPAGWTGGFALPDYVKAEPYKRGAMHTHWARRKTIPTLIPASLGNDFPDEIELERMLEKGEPLEMVLPQEVYAMDGVEPQDPIKLYGERASEYILGTIREVPTEFRNIALEALLDEVEPGLYDRVTKRANQYRNRGMSSKAAVQVAMASSMSEGMAKELIKLGSGKVPAMRSQLGLGFYGDTAKAIAFGGLWGSIKSGFKKVGRGIKKGAGYVKKGAQASYKWGKQAVTKLGSLACGAMRAEGTAEAIQSAAKSYKGGKKGAALAQVGVVGAQVGAALCAETPAVPQQEFTQPQQYGTPKWILPVAIGGAGLLAVLLITRK